MKTKFLIFILGLVIWQSCTENEGKNKVQGRPLIPKDVKETVHSDTVMNHLFSSDSGYSNKIMDTAGKKKSANISLIDRFEKRLLGKWEHYESYVEGDEGTSLKGKKEQLNFLPGRRMKIIRNGKMIEDTYRLREIEWGLPNPSIILKRKSTGEEWEVYMKKEGPFEYLYMKMPLVADRPVDVYRRLTK